MCRRDDNIKMFLKEMGCDNVDCIKLASNSATMNTNKISGFINAGNFFTERLLASQRKNLLHGLWPIS
jgi:hypothetical protein